MKDVATLLADYASSRANVSAVIDSSRSVSFAEFDSWTNAVAHQINAASDGKPRVCLVVAGFDSRAIVGMFAVLKTNQIFAALDREIPPANLSEISVELEAGCCLYTADAEEAVKTANLNIPKVRIDEPPAGTVAPLAPLNDMDRVALLKRTSGSTGKAKTVSHLCGAVLTEAGLGAKVLDLQPGAKLSVVSTFDAALTSAATLRVILAGTTLMPVDLRFENPKSAVGRLVDNGLTHVYCTPTAMRVLTQGLSKGGIFPDLRCILLGGEKTTMADVRLVSKSTPQGAKLRSTFASTETQLVGHTTIDLGADFGMENFAELDLADGVQIDILDEEGKTKPNGETGRVRVVSKMIAVGYLGDVAPELAAKFQANSDGSRSYLTDDLGYLTPEGRLVLKSRTGSEVKIRGRRVDLTELEAWLTGRPGIREAAVVPQPIGPGGELRLTAFIQGERGAFDGTKALRETMQSELVASMVPTAIVEVDHLPRTPNQKINRRELEKDLSHLTNPNDSQFEATGTMGALVKIWNTILSGNVDDPDAHFFDLGGDSISATLAAVKFEEEFGITIDTGFVYRVPVLSDQVDEVDRLQAGVSPVPDRLIVPLTKQSLQFVESDNGPTRVFLISGSGGHVFPFAPLAEELLPNWDLVGILHPNILDVEAELSSVEAYAERMAKAIKALQPQGPYLIVGYSFGGAVAHEIGRIFSSRGEQTAITIVDLKLACLEPFMRLADKKWERLKVRFGFGEEIDEQTQIDDEIRVEDDPDLDEAERARLKASFRRMYGMLEAYRPKTSTCSTTLIKAEMTHERFDANDFGWGKVAPVDYVEVVPGNHLNLFKGELLPGFAKATHKCLSLLDSKF